MTSSWQLVKKETGEVVVSALEVADGYWSRLVGLQFRKALPAGGGMLLVPCGSIHTFMVRFALDVVFLDRQGRVAGVRRDVRPNRLAIALPGTHAVLEMPAGTARVEVGDTLRVEPADPATPPRRSLQFLSETAVSG